MESTKANAAKTSDLREELALLEADESADDPNAMAGVRRRVLRAILAREWVGRLSRIPRSPP